MTKNNNPIEIPAVSDNDEKRDTYKRNMQRFSRAKNEGFYFESLWILHAMIEDRTTSFLFHIGFVGEKKRSSVAKRVRTDVRQIIERPDGNHVYGFDKLSGKLDAIAKVLHWAQTAEKLFGYQKDLQELIVRKVKVRDVQDALHVLDDWRNFRNQIVHALFNKKGAEVEIHLERRVNDGYEAVRKLDNAIKAIKRGAGIRKRYNIQ